MGTMAKRTEKVGITGVWNQVRSLSEENCEENGDQPTLQVHLHLLWQGQDEARVCRDLEVWRQELSCPGCRRCLHLHHHCRSLQQVCREASEGDEGAVDPECEELSLPRLYLCLLVSALGWKRSNKSRLFQ